MGGGEVPDGDAKAGDDFVGSTEGFDGGEAGVVGAEGGVDELCIRICGEEEVADGFDGSAGGGVVESEGSVGGKEGDEGTVGADPGAGVIKDIRAGQSRVTMVLPVRVSVMRMWRR